MLLEKSRWPAFKVSYKWFFLFWSKRRNLKTSKLNKHKGCLLEEIVTGFEYISRYISFDCNQVFEFKVLIIALPYLGFCFSVKWFSCSHSVSDILAFLSFLSFWICVNSVIHFRTFKLDCPFEILFRASKDGSSLEVKRVIEKHSHEINEASVTLIEWFGFSRTLFSVFYFLPVK